MPIVPAKCPNCAANLEVNSSQDAAICTHCGTPFIVEKAITNYQINNHISANVVNVYGGLNSDFEIIGGVLTKYKGASLNVVVPNNVSVIGKCAFYSTMITSVTIPDSVIEIGDGAFSKCPNLRSVSFPISLKRIGESAFWSSGLESVDVPSSVELVSINAFSDCNNLKSVKVGANTIDLEAFANCKSLNSVEVSNGTQTIWSSAFKGCTSLKRAVLPNTLVNIQNTAFESCKDLTVVWPSNYRKKQVTKLLVTLSMLGVRAQYYTFPNLEPENRKKLTHQVVYHGKIQTNGFGTEYLFQDNLNECLNMPFETGYSSSIRYEFIRNTDVKFKEVLDLITKAGIEKEVIKKISIPVYYVGFFGKRKQVNSYEAITIQLTEV